MTDNVRPPDPIDWNAYEDGGGGKPLPPTGVYDVEVVAVQTTDANGKLLRSSAGYFQPIVDVKVIAVGQPHDGFLSRFNRFNTKRWPNKNASGLGDYLRGFGFPGPFATDDEYAKAALATKGRKARMKLDWEVYDAGAGINIKGMENFPSDESGKKRSKVSVKGQDFYANVRVKYVESAVVKR